MCVFFCQFFLQVAAFVLVALVLYAGVRLFLGFNLKP